MLCITTKLIVQWPRWVNVAGRSQLPLSPILSALPQLPAMPRIDSHNAVSCQLRSHALQQSARLFDHLVGESKQRGRNSEAEFLGGLEVDRQQELCRALNRQIRVRAFENAVNVSR